MKKIFLLILIFILNINVISAFDIDTEFEKLKINWVYNYNWYTLTDTYYSDLIKENLTPEEIRKKANIIFTESDKKIFIKVDETFIKLYSSKEWALKWDKLIDILWKKIIKLSNKKDLKESEILLMNKLNEIYFIWLDNQHKNIFKTYIEKFNMEPLIPLDLLRNNSYKIRVTWEEILEYNYQPIIDITKNSEKIIVEFKKRSLASWEIYSSFYTDDRKYFYNEWGDEVNFLILDWYRYYYENIKEDKIGFKFKLPILINNYNFKWWYEEYDEHNEYSKYNNFNNKETNYSLEILESDFIYNKCLIRWDTLDKIYYTKNSKDYNNLWWLWFLEKIWKNVKCFNNEKEAEDAWYKLNYLEEKNK